MSGAEGKAPGRRSGISEQVELRVAEGVPETSFEVGEKKTSAVVRPVRSMSSSTAASRASSCRGF